MLALLSIPAQLCAQCDDMNETPADRIFNTSKYLMRHRHVAYLENGNKMTIELFYLDDYATLKNIDSLVRTVMQEIAFYKDSLDDLGTDNVRIDYAYTRDNRFKKIRFKRYNAGNSFASLNGNVSALKLNQDTIRIKISNEEAHIYRCPSAAERWKQAEKTHPVQITFVLNSYSDINELAKRGVLNRIKDTFITRVNAENSLKNSSRYSTIFYSPYAQEDLFVLKKDYLLSDEGEEGSRAMLAKSDVITGTFAVGAGLVRNKIAPNLNFGLSLNIRKPGTNDDYKMYGVHASPYYFFNKQYDGKYRTYISWFINASYGNIYSSKSDSKFNEVSFGLGYLINPDGAIFQKQTVKGFFNFVFRNNLAISPEVIATNNFRNIIPAVSFRFFGAR